MSICVCVYYRMLRNNSTIEYEIQQQLITSIFNTADEKEKAIFRYMIYLFVFRFRTKSWSQKRECFEYLKQDVTSNPRKKTQKIRVVSGRFVACHISSVQRPTGWG